MKTREIKESDIVYFGKNAREEDKAECLTVRNIPLEEHIRIGKKESLECFSFVDDNDNPIALYGIVKNNDIYCVWLLTTKETEKHKLSFMKTTKKEVVRFYKKYGILWLMTDSRYERAIKLNLWCGFREWGEPVFINDVKFRIYRFDGEV